MHIATTAVSVLGTFESRTIARRKKGAAPSAELNTRISVICMVNASSIQSPR